jgi:dipeptidyl aminopeptidase/acylaminoacyl peptidase
VVSFFGPTDLASGEWGRVAEVQNLVPLLGATRAQKPDVYRKASPITYAHKKAPPFLFFHGTEDKVVHPDQSRRLARKLRDAGVSAKVVEVEGEGHGWKGDKLVRNLDEMLIFFDEHLKR